MGYDIFRFEGEVDEDLMCSICCGVLEEPLHAPQCEHAFCKSCINEWLTRQPSCPVDRQRITTNELKPVPRVLRNFLSRLMIKCDFAHFGCTTVVKLERLEAHKQECEHNPKRPVPCAQGCGLTVELKDNNCSREVIERTLALEEVRREILFMREREREILLMREREEERTTRWANSLQRARVTNWAFLFPTPRHYLYTEVLIALNNSRCPVTTAATLMENAAEGGWPAGLRTLATRDSNQQYYENYVCRRIPGVQAVVVMAMDNSHMNDDMVLVPGHVMIFSGGII